MTSGPATKTMEIAERPDQVRFIQGIIAATSVEPAGSLSLFDPIEPLRIAPD